MTLKQLNLYVSAGADLDAECERVGQLLAEMTRSVRWTIKRTPRSYEPGNPDLLQLQRSHFYLILLGMDVTAPMGVEWRAARDAGLATLAYRNIGVISSPSALIFGREPEIPWRPYRSLGEFVRLFERDLVTRLIQGTPGYGLDLADIEELSRRLADRAQLAEDEERRGAGRGGVILPA
jgi:hypothetical protein